jgi:hypothetical protein
MYRNGVWVSMVTAVLTIIIFARMADADFLFGLLKAAWWL